MIILININEQKLNTILAITIQNHIKNNNTPMSSQIYLKDYKIFIIETYKINHFVSKSGGKNYITISRGAEKTLV